jgi:hypothetical protein
MSSVDYILKSADLKELEKSHKQFIHKLWDGTKVFLVDGDWVRDNMNDEFIGGGHGFQDDYIPENEIWSELVKDPVDNKEILIHEIIEYIFMKYFHKKYDDSHEIANSVEDTIRRLPDKPGSPMPLTLYEERKEEGGNDDELGNSMNTGIETAEKVSEYLARGRIKVSFVKHCPGHKDSKGNKAEYCILSHTTNKILSSHKTRSEAEKHLQQMHIHKGETIMEFKDVKSIEELIRVKEAVPQDLAEEFNESMTEPNPKYDTSLSGIKPARQKIFPSERLWGILAEIIQLVGDIKESGMVSDESIKIIKDCQTQLWSLPEVQETAPRPAK